MKISKIPKTAATLGMGIICSFAFAQDNPSESQWSLGLGAITKQKIYRSIDRENFVLPHLSYENKWVSVSGLKVDLKLYEPDESSSFRLRARYDGDGYDPEDSTFLSGMEKRKSSVWIGGASTWKSDYVNVTAELLHDALGNSKGTRASVLIDHRFVFDKFGLTPRMGVEWYDRKFVDYYYGVRASEATTVRSAYQGESTTALDVGLRLDYSPARQHTLFLDVGAKKFGSAIKDSPIVEKSNQTTVAIGYLYRY